MAADLTKDEMLSVGQVLRPRTIVFGLMVGTVTTMENIYFALKFGYTTTNNISAAILGFGVMRTINRWFGGLPFSRQENCILMTVAVASTAMVWGGSMPFALLAMSNEIKDSTNLDGDASDDIWRATLCRLLLYSASLCFIGFCLAIPLREKFVVNNPLPFPYALAAAKTIESLHLSEDGDISQPLVLVKSMLPAFGWGMLTWSFDGMEKMPLFGLRAQSRYSWEINLSAAPLGRGLIVPARYILSELLGASVASGILLPVAYSKRNIWYEKNASGFEGLDAYYLMPAIFAVAFDSTYQLGRILALFVLPALLAAINRKKNTKTTVISPLLPQAEFVPDFNYHQQESILEEDRPVIEISKNQKRKKILPLWLIGWFFSSLAALIAFRNLFNTRYDMATIALLSSPLWAVGITMAVGTTGSNVASSCGKVMIMIFATWYGTSGHAIQSLALGALAIAVIDQALDLVRDFKTAHLLNCSPKAMFIAQSLGAIVSIFTSSVLYHYYISSVSLPSANLPCIIAKSYRALAVTFAGGLSELPTHCLHISIATGCTALLFNILHDCILPPRLQKFCPSAVAFGVGIILLPGQIIVEVLGLSLRILWSRLYPQDCKERHELIGAALLAGDGLAGVLQSVLQISGIDPPRSCSYRGWYN